MKQPVWFISLLVMLVVAACTMRLLFPGWLPAQYETIVTSSGKKLNVTFKSKPCVYIAPNHASGIYLSSGAAKVDIKAWNEIKLSFAADEELGLFAIHELDDKFYLVFTTEYQPERGFVVFASGINENLFRPVAVNTLPPQLAYPNFGSRVVAMSQVMATHGLPPPEFYHTKTAWLWSQIATNKSVLSESLDADEVDKFWNTWAGKFAVLMEAH